MSAIVAARLRACEGIIERGQQTFIEVGQALARIRDERLFREAGYTSFDDYCQARWAMKKAYANHLIAGSELATNVAAPPANEGQARALRRVPHEDREQVWEEVQQVAANTGAPVTAALIDKVASGADPEAKCQHCSIHCPSGRYGSNGRYGGRPHG